MSISITIYDIGGKARYYNIYIFCLIYCHCVFFFMTNLFITSYN